MLSVPHDKPSAWNHVLTFPAARLQGMSVISQHENEIVLV